MLSQILGWVATILFSAMIVPQMMKTIKTKDTKGISKGFFILYLIANIDALFYSMLIGQVPLLIKYSFGIVTTIIYLMLYKKYNDNRIK